MYAPLREQSHPAHTPVLKHRREAANTGNTHPFRARRHDLGNQALQRLSKIHAHSSNPASHIGVTARQGTGGSGSALPYRDDIQSAFGRYDISGVQAHLGNQARLSADRLDAHAYTLGEHIAFRQSPDLHTAAHETAHVIQQRLGITPPPGRAEAPYEHHADAVADRVVRGQSAESLLDGLPLGASPALSIQFERRRRRPTALQNAFDGIIPWTRDLAREALDEYDSLSDADQQSWVETHYPGGVLERLLRAMAADEITSGGSYNEVVQSILQRVQRIGAIGFAATLGMATLGDMAQRQSSFMHQRNVAAAIAAAPPGTMPSEADIAAQHAQQVAPTSIARQTGTLSAADERAHNTQARAAVTDFVTWVQAQHPLLNITEANFRVDSRAVFNRGQNIIGFADQAHRRVVIGRTFALLVDANPAYALSNVMHELRGHNEYGPYGRPGTEFGLELYDQAAALMPGYSAPTGADRQSEIDAFAYQETEIYSQLIEVDFHTPVAAADSHLASANADPATVVSRRIGIIRRQWEPQVAQALVRGLLLRFRLDPRLSSTAVGVFEQAIRNNFPATRATAILR